MSFELRLSLCVFLALYITPNGAQKSLLIVGLGKEDDQESDVSYVDIFAVENDIGRYTQTDRRNEEIDDAALLSHHIAQNPILRRGLEHEDGLSILRALDQIDENINEYNNKFEAAHDSRIDDVHILGTQNKGMNKNFVLLLIKGKSDEYSFSEKSHLEISSLKCDRNYRNKKDDTNLLNDSKHSLRSGAWKTCGKKAAEKCKKACEEAIKRGCSGSACKSKLKERMTKDCKFVCKDRFGIEAIVEKGNNRNQLPRTPQNSRLLVDEDVEFTDAT